jgi:hypothetical protein
VRLLHFSAALIHMLTLNRQWHGWAEMSDTGLTMQEMTEPPCRYGVTIAVDRGRDGGHLPNPAEFAVAAEQAASARAVRIVSATRPASYPGQHSDDRPTWSNGLRLTSKLAAGANGPAQ